MFLLFTLFTAFPPIGVHPSQLAKYKSAIDEEKKTFACFGDKKIISLEKLNDGFPDCEDGSDEPGTSTFINGTFYCQNKGYIPKILQKWSVGDGICDCCDGSDEFYNTHVHCPNTCGDAEKKRKQIFEKLDSIIKEGIRIREAREKEGKEKLRNAKSMKSKIDSEISKLEEDKRRVESTKALSTPTPKPTPDPLPRTTPTPEPEEEEEDQEEMKNRIKELEEKIEELKVEEGEGNKDATSALENLKVKLEDLKGKLQETKDSEQTPEEEAEAEGEEVEYSFEDNDEESLQNKEHEPESEPAPKEDPKKEDEEEEDKDEDEKVLWKRIIKAIWKFTFNVPDVKSTLEERKRQKLLDSLSEKIRKLKDQRREFEETADIDDKTDPAFISIYKKSFKKDDFEYIVLKEVKKSYTSYGNYRKTEDGVQKFDGGQHCWQTQCGRKTTMELVCWNKDKLVSVLEIDQCVHRAVFATPSVCTKDSLKALNNRTVEELREIALKANYKI